MSNFKKAKVDKLVFIQNRTLIITSIFIVLILSLTNTMAYNIKNDTNEKVKVTVASGPSCSSLDKLTHYIIEKGQCSSGWDTNKIVFMVAVSEVSKLKTNECFLVKPHYSVRVYYNSSKTGFLLEASGSRNYCK